MHKTDLIKEIANNADLSQKDAGSALDAFIKVVTKALKKGDTVALIGFGTFSKARRAARIGVNPSTGERIKIKAKTLPKFRPGKAWKEMM